MKVEIDERLISLLKERKAMLLESDLETKARGGRWFEQYQELCVRIANRLSLMVVEGGGRL